MSPTRRIMLATVLGGVASAGTFALAATGELGLKTKAVPVDEQTLASRDAALTAAEQSAAAALAAKPPALPPIPDTGPLPIPNLPPILLVRAGAASRTPAQAVTARRPRHAGGASRPSTPTRTRHRDEGGEPSEAQKQAAERAREAAKDAAERAKEDGER